MAHANEDRVRQGYEAFAKGDLEGVGTLFSDDIVWHVPGKNQFSGDYKGVQEVIGFFGKTMEWANGTFKVQTHDIIANDTHGIGLVTASGERDGKRWTDNQVHVLHLTDGKVVEYWGHPGDQYATDEFWG